MTKTNPTAQARWIAICADPTTIPSHRVNAADNADATAREEDFEIYSERWFEVALSTYYSYED